MVDINYLYDRLPRGVTEETANTVISLEGGLAEQNAAFGLSNDNQRFYPYQKADGDWYVGFGHRLGAEANMDTKQLNRLNRWRKQGMPESHAYSRLSNDLENAHKKARVLKRKNGVDAPPESFDQALTHALFTGSEQELPPEFWRSASARDYSAAANSLAGSSLTQRNPTIAATIAEGISRGNFDETQFAAQATQVTPYIYEPSPQATATSRYTPPLKKSRGQVLDQTRDQIEGFQSKRGARFISGDFNDFSDPNVQGFEIVMPSDSTPAEIAKAEQWIGAVDNFYKSKGLERNNRGVKVVGQNTQRGVDGVIHTEPFFAKDIEARRLIEANAAEFAQITKDTIGSLDGSTFIAPHKTDDGGAVTPDGVNERDWWLDTMYAPLANVQEIAPIQAQDEVQIAGVSDPVPPPSSAVPAGPPPSSFLDGEIIGPVGEPPSILSDRVIPGFTADGNTTQGEFEAALSPTVSFDEVSANTGLPLGAVEIPARFDDVPDINDAPVAEPERSAVFNAARDVADTIPSPLQNLEEAGDQIAPVLGTVGGLLNRSLEPIRSGLRFARDDIAENARDIGERFDRARADRTSPANEIVEAFTGDNPADAFNRRQVDNVDFGPANLNPVASDRAVAGQNTRDYLTRLIENGRVAAIGEGEFRDGGAFQGNSPGNGLTEIDTAQRELDRLREAELERRRREGTIGYEEDVQALLDEQLRQERAKQAANQRGVDEANRKLRQSQYSVIEDALAGVDAGNAFDNIDTLSSVDATRAVGRFDQPGIIRGIGEGSRPVGIDELNAVANRQNTLRNAQRTQQEYSDSIERANTPRERAVNEAAVRASALSRQNLINRFTGAPQVSDPSVLNGEALENYKANLKAETTNAVARSKLRNQLGLRDENEQLLQASDDQLKRTQGLLSNFTDAGQLDAVENLQKLIGIVFPEYVREAGRQ